MALALSAGSAPAMPPLLPTCSADLMGAAERREFQFDPPAHWVGVPVDQPARGWVFHVTHERPVISADGSYDRDSLRLVLEHCGTRHRLIAWVGTVGLDASAYGQRFEALAFGLFNRASDNEARRYTLVDLAGWARAQGDRARLDRTGYVSCACAAADRMESEGR